RMLILFFVLAATFLVAHTINAVIAEALFVPSAIAPQQAVLDGDGSMTRSPSALAEQVRMSGLFPLPPDSTGLTGGGAGGGGPVRQALNVASKIKLLGVVVGDRVGVSAIIEELSSKRQLFFRLHDQIPDVGEISEIRNNGIVIRQGDQQDLLELSTGQADKPPVPQVASTGPASA